MASLWRDLRKNSMEYPVNLKELYLNEMEAFVLETGEKKFRAKQIYSFIHEHKVDSIDKMTSLSLSYREKLKELVNWDALTYVTSLKSSDGETEKFLFRLHDGELIESVLMHYNYGYTVCVSSQAGCRMGCKFCASTINGLARNLTASEILEEVYTIERIAKVSVSHIVIMGSGEPLDNYDNVVRFIRLFSDESGNNKSARNVTLSTCGLTSNIYKLASEGLPITLALSLHAPNDEIRKEIMPVAKAYALSEVLKACDFYYEKTGRRLTFEYSLMKGINDTIDCASKLSKLLAGKNCHVNLIPVNEVKERGYSKSLSKDIEDFKKVLEKNHIPVTVRREMGADINAACGQLRLKYSEDNN
ncbi:MAG: 23S rRNA (adenine(2503)-C(2))-methyltransferase RlmN [Lachnospiraceae bacterium]|nr:23S rRNA (adenine(2503)-C(2))-methyltransferase RlmN [Lachnospiraceae bacterium]